MANGIANESNSYPIISFGKRNWTKKRHESLECAPLCVVLAPGRFLPDKDTIVYFKATFHIVAVVIVHCVLLLFIADDAVIDDHHQL